MKDYLIPALGYLLLAFVVFGGLCEGYRHEKRRRFILEYLSIFRDGSRSELVAYSKGLLTRKTVRELLDELVREELVSSRESGHRTFFSLTELGHAEAAELAGQAKARAR